MSRLNLFRLVACAAFVFGLCGVTNAQVTYSYAGGNFTNFFGGGPWTAADSISGSFTVDAALSDNTLIDFQSSPPAGFSWSFTDGVHSFASGGTDSINSNGGFFVSMLNGAVNGWSISLIDADSSARMLTASGGDLSQMLLGALPASASAPAGSWTITTAVPEPEIYAMLGLGLGFLGWTSRRRKLETA